MAEDTIAEIRLNDLTRVVKGLSSGKALFQIECCIWCMSETEKENGSNLRAIEDDDSGYYRVTWDVSPLLTMIRLLTACMTMRGLSMEQKQ